MLAEVSYAGILAEQPKTKMAKFVMQPEADVSLHRPHVSPPYADSVPSVLRP